MARFPKRFRLLDDEGEIRRPPLPWLAIILVILIGMNPPKFFFAIRLLADAAVDWSVLIVFGVAILSYLAVAFFVNPIGTAMAFSGAIQLVQRWERGGRLTEWIQGQVWRLHQWLESRKSMEMGYSPDHEQDQLRALFEINKQVRMSARNKLKRIRSIRRNALNASVESAAARMEEQLSPKAPGAATEKAKRQAGGRQA